MWQSLFPERPADTVPIGHITNGVHVPTWMAPRMRDLLDRYLGTGWEARAAEGQSDVDALLRDAAREVVDYMLFVDEAPLPGPIEGSAM